MKTLKKLFIFLIVVLIIFRGIMVYTTNDLINYVERIMLNEIPLEETEGTRFHLYQSKSKYTIDKAEVSINRGWIFHDFKKGVINLNYRVAQYSGEKCVYFSSAPSEWLIEKKDGKWEIVKIIEKP